MTRINVYRSSAESEYPLCRPNLDLDFTQGKLDPRITFTRASKATYVGYDGLIKTAEVNEPRFDYDPITRKCNGLLCEGSGTNYGIHSGRLDVSWLVNVSGGSGTFIDGEAVTSSILPMDGFYDASLSSSSIFVIRNSTTGQPYGVLTGLQSGATRNITDRTGINGFPNLSAFLTTETTAPDGSYTAILCNPTTPGVQSRNINRYYYTTTNGTYTFSVFVKNKNIQLNRVALSFGEETGTSGTYANFNIATKTFLDVGGNNGWSATTGYQEYSNGWIRIWITATTAGSFTRLSGAVWPGGFQGTDSGIGSLYLWGAQLEGGLVATSYIPTLSSQVSRNQDLATITGTNFSSWYNTTEGTILVNNICRVPGSYSPQNNSMFSITNSDKTSLINAWYNDFSGALIAIDAYGITSYLPVTNVPGGRNNIPIRQSVAYKNLDFRAVTNGHIISNDLSNQIQDFLPTDFDRLIIGNGEVYTGPLNGTISRLTYYPKALKTNQLVYLTQ